MYVRPLLWKSLPLLIPSHSHNPHQCNCFHLLTIFNQASIYTASLHLFLARLSLLLKTSFLVPTCLWPLLHHQPSVPDYENCLLFTAPVLPVPPSPTKVSRSWSWPSSHLNHCSACVIPAVTLIYLILLYRYHWIDASATSWLRLKWPDKNSLVLFLNNNNCNTEFWQVCHQIYMKIQGRQYDVKFNQLPEMFCCENKCQVYLRSMMHQLKIHW